MKDNAFEWGWASQWSVVSSFRMSQTTIPLIQVSKPYQASESSISPAFGRKSALRFPIPQRLTLPKIGAGNTWNTMDATQHMATAAGLRINCSCLRWAKRHHPSTELCAWMAFKKHRSVKFRNSEEIGCLAEQFWQSSEPNGNVGSCGLWYVHDLMVH